MARRILSVLVLPYLMVALCIPALGQAAKPAAKAGGFKPDDKVEVREGDEWSAATIVKQEGRKILIRYEDGTEEWVTSDRLRQPGVAGKAPAAADKPAGPAKPVAPAKPAVKEQFAVGAKIEVKDHSSWDPATIKNRDGDLYLVATDRFPTQFHWKWAHVSGVRKIGSSKEGPSRAKTVGVHNQSIDKARLEARKAFANIEEELAADATRGDKAASPFAAAPYDKPISDVKFDKVNDLLAAGAPAKLGVFDPLPAAAAKLSGKPVTIKGKGEWPKESVETVLIGGGKGVVPHYSGSASDMRTLRIELLDLAGGKNVGMIKADPLSKPMALSPSGNRMAGVAHGFHSGTRKRVDIFELAPGATELEHLISFTPYVTSEYHWKDVEWVSFADDDHLMTCTWQGDLICWDPAKATALWRIKTADGTYPVVSPGARQVAVLTDQGITIIDAIAGKVLCVAEGRRSSGSVAFSPDGKRLIGLSGRTVFGWDLEKGAALPEIGLPMASHGDVIPLSARFVLIGGSDLLDLDKKVVVWRYTKGGSNVFFHAGRCWMLTGGHRAEQTVLSSSVLPHANAVKMADTVKIGEGLLVKPGSAVALSVTLEATPEQQQKIAAAITEQLQKLGIKVDPASPIKLIARTETGKTTEQEYQRRGIGNPFSRETEKVTVTEKITRIFFEHEGKVAWESRTSSGAPMFVQAKEGETIGQAVQAASQFNVSFLESVRVPAYVPAPIEKPWLGTSAWTTNGVGKDELAARPAAAGDGLD
jgi:hypothetical protein